MAGSLTLPTRHCIFLLTAEIGFLSSCTLWSPESAPSSSNGNNSSMNYVACLLPSRAAGTASPFFNTRSNLVPSVSKSPKQCATSFMTSFGWLRTSPPGLLTLLKLFQHHLPTTVLWIPQSQSWVACSSPRSAMCRLPSPHMLLTTSNTLACGVCPSPSRSRTN